LYSAEIGHFVKEIRNTWKVFKCVTGKWRSDARTVLKLKKYYMESRRKSIF
jgi:hypothetical protein